MDLITHRISVASIQRRAREIGIASVAELAKSTGVNFHTARRYWTDDPSLANFESRVLLKLCAGLQLKMRQVFEIVERANPS